MTATATITSKRQLTIPAKMFKQLGFKKGDKVLIEDTGEGLHIKKTKSVIAKLAGSVSVPHDKKSVRLDEAITQAKKRSFNGLAAK